MPAQEEIDFCDRKGPVNATIPAGEDLDTFVALVSSAAALADVQEIVQNILEQTK